MNFLLIHSDTTAISNTNGTSFMSLWFLISLVEFIIIILLLLKWRKQKTNLVFSELDKIATEKAKNTSIDMNSLMDNINNSNSLYKELSRKYHPDRFINTPKQELAEKIFQDISRNKRNHEKLMILKKRAELELDIN